MEIVFGIQFMDLVRLSQQLSLALVGAAGLWGFIFWWKGYGELVEKMRVVLFASGALFFVSWVAASIINPEILYAHEGISRAVSDERVAGAYTVTSFFVGPMVLLMAMYLGRIKKQITKDRYEGGILIGFFVLVSALMAMSAFTDSEVFSDALFDFGHSWHSILTVATVLIIDYLFFVSYRRDHLKRMFFPFLPIMSLAIWVGLAIDFLSVQLIFRESIALTEKFFFVQTLIGIIILNGVFLSGPIARKLRSRIMPDRILPTPEKWHLWMGIAGSISIVSWLSITALDFFPGLTLGYGALLALYTAALVVVYIIQRYLERERVI